MHPIHVDSSSYSVVLASCASCLARARSCFGVLTFPVPVLHLSSTTHKVDQCKTKLLASATNPCDSAILLFHSRKLLPEGFCSAGELLMVGVRRTELTSRCCTPREPHRARHNNGETPNEVSRSPRKCPATVFFLLHDARLVESVRPRFGVPLPSSPVSLPPRACDRCLRGNRGGVTMPAVPIVGDSDVRVMSAADLWLGGPRSIH